jgi:hypothetical protein
MLLRQSYVEDQPRQFQSKAEMRYCCTLYIAVISQVAILKFCQDKC